MKTIIIYLMVFLFLTARFLAQDTIIDFNRPHYNTSQMESTHRLLNVTPFPCSCPCSTMVKSAIIYNEQGDDELQLVGGYITTEPSGLTCQRIELNISACNNQSISSISINFESSDDNCFNNKFWLYRDNGDGTVTYSDDFYPQADPQEFGILTLDPALQPCSSGKYVFYICSSSLSNCEGDDYTVSVTVNGQNPGCEKNMSWHFDFLLGLMINKQYLDIQSLELSNALNTKYQIIDIFTNQVITGEISRLNEIEEIKRKVTGKKGFFIFNITEDDKIIYQEKFINH